jgi:hypothetical protein
LGKPGVESAANTRVSRNPLTGEEINTAGSYAQGIPGDIYQGIRQKAASEWPNDFHMQMVVIKTQCEAYHQVNH